MDYKTYITESRFCECDYATITVDRRAIRLMHGALGLTTELLELQQAARTADMNNACLELGDIAWFVALICDELKIAPARVGNPLNNNIPHLCAEVEYVASAIKAHVIYKRDLPADFAARVSNVFHIAISIGNDQLAQNILIRNMDKLKVRYKDKYSTAAANNRNIDKENAVVTSLLTRALSK